MNQAKLVRDKIPEIIEANDGKEPSWRFAENNAEHRSLLHEKLSEELEEYQAAKTRDERVEELADITEVIYSFATLEDYTDFHLEHLSKAQKAHSDEIRDYSLRGIVERFSALQAALSDTPSSSERLEKLAGLLSCTHELSALEGVQTHEVEEVRMKKREERGSFIGGVVLLNW